MVEEAIRLIRPGLHQPKRGRLAVLLIAVLLIPIFQPVQADISVERDDFGLMEKLSDLMEVQEASDDALIAAGSSTSSLALVEAAKRESREGDPLNDSTEYLTQAQLRDTTPLGKIILVLTKSSLILTHNRTVGQTTSYRHCSLSNLFPLPTLSL